MQDDTGTPSSLSAMEPDLSELWVLEGGLEALLLVLPDLMHNPPDVEADRLFADIAGFRRLQ